MQKFCIWETEYKTPKIDCIKLQSQSKLQGHCCVFSSPQCWCTRFGDWIAINSIGREKESTRREKKNSVCFKCPYHSCIFVWDYRFITWMTVRSKKKRKKEKKKETRFFKFNVHKKARVVIKISNFRVNTTSRGEGGGGRGIKQQGISFVSIFLLFSYEVSKGNPQPPPLNDSPVLLLFFSKNCT